MNLLFFFLALTPQFPVPDTAMVHELPGVTISVPLKHNEAFSEQPVAVTSFSVTDMVSYRIEEPKDISLLVPNFIHADYGAKMTGSMYIRGIGARMDQPAMGLYLDNVPVLNKNNYDFDYFDVRRINVLRGPQGTLYGRNTIGGVIDIYTLSPFDYQGSRIKAEYGNANTWIVRASTYHRPKENWAFSIALNHHSSDGFFTNVYDETPADRILSESGRIKFQAKLSQRWIMENILSANFVKQKGFAYSLYDEINAYASPVNHNDPCTYDRFGLTDGLIFRYEGKRIRLSSTTSYQFMDDDMILDQDFRSASMFTLHQSQRENAFTQEIVVRPADEKQWQWISGAFGFYKHLRMAAPVVFKQDGIDELILANANAGIHTVFPDADLLIREEQFPIESHFHLPAFGFSLYHQSDFKAGRWKFIGGIRADYEHTAISYDNYAGIHYRFTLTMPEYKYLPVEMSGAQNKSFFEVMPKIAATCETKIGTLYVTVARGYKAGGFNTQIFSDILQNKMMGDMMADMGIYFEGHDPGYDIESAISYKPEYNWNYEIGGHFSLFNRALLIDAALFYIDCRDQQLTVFPPGKTTGRLMSNAGHTQSMGGEISLYYSYKNFRFTGIYGYTNAKFVTYDNGNENFSGKHVPYAPVNTVSVDCQYRLNIFRKWADCILFDLCWQGAGKIYWNESNTISQPFYGLLNATVAYTKSGFTLGVWGKNVTGTDYNTFYFKSLGYSFVQRGKPLQIGIFINLNL